MYNIHAIFSQIYYFCVTSKYILYFDKNAPLIQLQLFSLLILEDCFTYAALFSYLFALSTATAIMRFDQSSIRVCIGGHERKLLV